MMMIVIVRNQTKPTPNQHQIKPNQIKPNQIKPNQIKPNQNQTKQCVKVGEDDYVMAEYPAISCKSNEYYDLAPAIWSLLVLIVILLPLVTIITLRWMYLYVTMFQQKKFKMKQRCVILCGLVWSCVILCDLV